MAVLRTRHLVVAIVLLFMLVVAAPGCSSGDRSTSRSSSSSAPATNDDRTGSSAPPTSPSAGDSSTVPPGGSTTVPTTLPIRTRDDLVAVLGQPDSFRAELDALDGQDVLVESLVYGEIGQRFDLIDNVVTGSESIDPFPDDTLFPLQYSMNEVRPGLTRADVDEFMTGVEFTEIDGEALGLPGATVLSAGQLVLALFDDRVIYVETFPLVPDPDGTYQAYIQGATP